MKNTIIIYLDFPTVPSDIKSVVDVDFLGDIIHRKKRLWESHKAIYSSLGMDNFFLVRNEINLKKVIELIQTSSYGSVIIQSVKFAITEKEHFINFLNRISFIDKDLTVADYQQVKSFAKVSCKTALEILKTIQIKVTNEEKVLEEFFVTFEPFRLEDFYIEITNYVEFISYLQSNFELRYFNTIEKNENIITKKSSDKAKLKREYEYHQFLPDELAIYFIKPFAFEEKEETSQYKMQRLNIPDLALQWIHYSITEKDFKILLDKLFNYLKIRPERKSDADFRNQMATDLYVLKLKERIVKLKESEIFASIEALIKTGTQFTGIDEIVDFYFRLYQAIVGKKAHNFPKRLVLGHGDFCLSNMLYDKRIDFIKFIDPKGGSTLEDVHMEEYYDVAKLSHSVLGNYDFINNGLFELEFSNELQLELKFDNLELLTQNKEAFKACLALNGFDYQLVRLLEASLFLSMLPLHIDNKKKVMAFVLTAIHILKEVDNVN